MRQQALLKRRGGVPMLGGGSSSGSVGPGGLMNATSPQLPAHLGGRGPAPGMGQQQLPRLRGSIGAGASSGGPILGGGPPTYGGGGNGYGGGGGGGTPGFEMGPRTQGPIDAHPYGDTVAAVNSGSDYHGLDALDVANADKPKLTSWGADWNTFDAPKTSWGATRQASTPPPGRAKGGPVRAGEPYLVGEEGPELVVPEQSGRVIPNNHVNWTGTYDPNFAPSLPSSAPFGHVAPLPDGQNGLQAFDANGNVVGYSTGVQAPVVAASAPPPSAPPVSAPVMHGIETQDQYNARRLAMNPQQIDVGFTPRPALHAFADADALRGGGQSREEAQYARMQREVMREARGNPRMAAYLLAGKAAAAKDQRKAEFEKTKHDDQVTHWDSESRRKSNAAAGYADTGAGVGQPMSPTVAALRLQHEDANRETVNKREAERLGISQAQLAIQQAAEQRAGEKLQRDLNPQGSVLSIPGTNLGRAMINGQEAHNIPTLEQTRPQQTMPTFPNATVIPPQFKPMTTEKNPDPTGVKAVKDHLSAISAIQGLLKADKEDSPMDPARRKQLETWLKHHSDAYEQGLGIPAEAPAPVVAAPTKPAARIKALMQQGF